MGLLCFGKHAKRSTSSTPIHDGGESEPALGALDKYTQEAKDALNTAQDALNTARSVATNQDAIDEVKEELSKGGRGKLFFFFVILLLNMCLGKFRRKIEWEGLLKVFIIYIYIVV